MKQFQRMALYCIMFTLVVGSAFVAPAVTLAAAGGWIKQYEALQLSPGQIQTGETRGQKFSTQSFSRLRVACPSWSNAIGNLTLKLFSWDTDYATTVAGTPIASQEFVDFEDNAWLELDFPTQPAGDYLWQLSDPVETVGVWAHLGSDMPGVVAYHNGVPQNYDYLAEAYVSVAPQPAGAPAGPTTGVTGQSMEFEAEAERADPADKGMVKYLFDWGDGTQTFSSPTAPTPSGGGASGRSSHAYNEPGVYEVKVLAYDIYGEPAAAWSSAAEVTVTGNVLPDNGIIPVLASASSEESASFAASKAIDGNSASYWSSAAGTGSAAPQWLAFDMGGVMTLDSVKVTPRAAGEGFPLSLKLQYSNDNAAWFDLPARVHEVYPNPGNVPQIVETGGIAARYVRLFSDRIGYDANARFQLAEVEFFGEAGTKFFTSKGGQFDAAWSNMWTIYGLANNELSPQGSRWTVGPGGILGIPSTEWLQWNAQKLSWTDEDKLKRQFKEMIYEKPMNPDGYVWAHARGEEHLDVSKHNTYNALYVMSVYTYFMWTQDESLLTDPLPPLTNPNAPAHPPGVNNLMDKLRKSIDYYVDRIDSQSGVFIFNEPGHDATETGLPSNYWDNFPFGYKDAYANILFYEALNNMAGLEDALGYPGNASTYRSYASALKAHFNSTFWDSSKGRYVASIDINGVKRDYGFTLVNTMAAEYGLADTGKARTIYDWLDGKRIVAGDTSQGSDIYALDLAPRTITKAIESDSPYWWYGNYGTGLFPDGNAYYGGHFQNGGVIFYTAYDDMMGRMAKISADSAFARMKTIIAEFQEDELRRNPINAVGWDFIYGIIKDFPESGIVPLVMSSGFLGLAPGTEGLSIRPDLPSELSYAGMRDVMYAGERYTVTASREVDEPDLVAVSPGVYEITVPNGWEVVVADGSIQQVTPGVEPPVKVNLALGKPASSSGAEAPSVSEDKAVDGNDGTLWGSDYFLPNPDDAWLTVDLGSAKAFNNVVIKWGDAYAGQYKLLVSDDQVNWTNVMDNDAILTGLGGTESIYFDTVSARYVKFQGIERSPVNGHLFGYVIAELEVYHEQDELKIIADSITQIPEIAQGQPAIVMPEVPAGYKVSVYGSDRQPVIDLTGSIHAPLTDAQVYLLFQVEDEQDPDRKAVSSNVRVTVPGQHTQASGLNEEPGVIPSLREWYGGTGSFELSASSRIVVNPLNSAALEAAASITKADLKDLNGYDLNIVYGTPGTGDIYLSLDSSLEHLGDEGYLFDVQDYVSIKSADVQGVFYGTRTALQILKQDSELRRIPKGTARDYPKYETRGLMLDVARKFYTIDFLRDYVKLMSWYKMNFFQIHLNDDIGQNGKPFDDGTFSAFRLESDVYPDLTSQTGSYTKQEFRELQLLGMDYGVNIVPEFETPGHSGVFINYDPLLGSQNYLDIRREETVQFVKSLYDEYLDGSNPTFIGPDVHIATDEYKVHTQDDVEAFRAYTDTLIGYINSKGKRPHLWGGLQAYDGDTPISNAATMDIWHTPYGGPEQAIDAGYDIVNVDSGYTYMIPTMKDYLDSRLLYNEWEPNKWETVALPYGHPKLKGGKFAFWNDVSHASGVSMHDSHERMLPAVQTLSEKTWTGSRADKDFAQFELRASAIGDAPNADISHKLLVDNPNGKVIEYRFENNYTDNSGNGFDGTGHNVTYAAGKFGQGIQFGGGASYVQTPLQSLGFGWTVSMWVKPDTGNPSNAVLMESPEGQLKLTQGTTGKLGFSKENYNSVFNYQVPTGVWTHLVLTGDRNGTTLYVNDNEYVEKLDGETLETFVLPLQRIGSATNSFKGTIDLVTVHNRTLGQIEPINLALNKPVSSSGAEVPSVSNDKAVDGLDSTRWGSDYFLPNPDNAWLTVDLGVEQEIGKAVIKWGDAYAGQFKLLVSDDQVNWTNVMENDAVLSGQDGTQTIHFNPITARYVKWQGIARTPVNGHLFGYVIHELEIY